MYNENTRLENGLRAEDCKEGTILLAPRDRCFEGKDTKYVCKNHFYRMNSAWEDSFTILDETNGWHTFTLDYCNDHNIFVVAPPIEYYEARRDNVYNKLNIVYEQIGQYNRRKRYDVLSETSELMLEALHLLKEKLYNDLYSAEVMLRERKLIS